MVKKSTASKADSKPAPKAAFDWKNPAPGYELIWQQRREKLRFIRGLSESKRASYMRGLSQHYKNNPWDFITDWGVTVDPRMVELDMNPAMPFVMFEKQEEWCKFVFRKWKDRKPGLTDKSRDGGLSWLEVALGCTLCLFHPGMNIGYGSVTEDYVDKLGEPKSLFWKARIFMQKLPPEFKGDWDPNRHAPHMRIIFPNGSTMTGQSGKNIGRGDRKSIYFVDESAHLEDPKSVDFALSQTTNCRQDISTPKGLQNSFSERRHAGVVECFTLHWRDDPRKDDAWYQKQCEDIGDPVVIAQEIDINYAASVTGVVIPHEWVRAAVNAHEKISLVPSGDRMASLDIADEGRDLNAFCASHGVLLTDLMEWSGIGSDIFYTVERGFGLCDKNEARKLKYDADGLGGGARGDARILNDARKAANLKEINVTAFRGSAGVFEPDGEDVKGRKNKDYFKNTKAQGWWSLRTRFRNIYRLVVEGKSCSHDDIICIPSTLPYFTKLISELSQPTFGQDTLGKMLINKQPDGTKSPNLADAVMMLYGRVERPKMRISQEALYNAAHPRRTR